MKERDRKEKESGTGSRLSGMEPDDPCPVLSLTGTGVLLLIFIFEAFV